MSKLLRFTVAVSSVLACLAICASAGAAPITVGSPLVGDFSNSTSGGPATWANTVLPEPGAHLTSPIAGTIARWRMTGAFEGGPFHLVVLHPTGGGEYAITATSPPETPTGSETNTFAAALPIAADDLIGINPTDAFMKIGSMTSVGLIASDSYWSPQLLEGQPARSPSFSFTQTELGFNADVQAPPAITSIGPLSGSIRGGTSVTITGTELEGVTGVAFSGVPASTFTSNSETQVTAIAPASTRLITGDITLETIAGTAASPMKFSYEGCAVPRLLSKRLKAAKKKLKAADCKLGKVKKLTGATAKTGKIRSQSPKAGKVLAPGSKVKITLKP